MLNSQMTCTSIRQVAAAYSSAKSNRKPATRAFRFHRKAALPLISCGQQVLNRSTEARAAQDHQQILELHADLHERQKEAREMRLQAAKQRDEADAKRHEMDAKLDVLLDKVDELLDRR